LQVLSQKNIEQQQRDTAATRKLEARAQLDRVLARIAVPLSLSLSSLSSLSLLSLSHISLSHLGGRAIRRGGGTHHAAAGIAQKKSGGSTGRGSRQGQLGVRLGL
jgi:hypothetical protein